MELESRNKKFTIITADGTVDMYLNLGFAGPAECARMPHLKEGDVCHIDISLSKQGDELRVYRVLMEMATMAIVHGATAREVASVLIMHAFPPQGQTTDNEFHFARSICDLVGKYLERYSKMQPDSEA